MAIESAGTGTLERIAEEPIAACRSSKTVVFSNPLSLVLDIYRPNLVLGSLVWASEGSCVLEALLGREQTKGLAVG